MRPGLQLLLLWTVVCPAVGQSEAGPHPRNGPMLVLDSLNQRIILFGGAAGPGNYFNDVWELPLDDSHRYHWRLLTPSGTAPPGRFEAAVVYDPPGQQLVVFGGDDGTRMFSDVWLLDLTSGSERWTQARPQGQPPAPRSHTYEVLCAPRRSLVLFGGNDHSKSFDDAWELNLDNLTWRRLEASGTRPGIRANGDACYDAAEDRMVIFGGFDRSAFLDEVWALNLTPDAESWSRLHPAGESPGPRAGFAHGFDSRRRELFVCCGWSHSGLHNDLYILELDASRWTRIKPGGTPPRPRRGPAGVYDQLSDRLFIYGGDNRSGFYGDGFSVGTHQLPAVWTLSTPSPGPVPTPRPVPPGPAPRKRGHRTDAVMLVVVCGQDAVLPAAEEGAAPSCVLLGARWEPADPRRSGPAVSIEARAGYLGARRKFTGHTRIETSTDRYGLDGLRAGVAPGGVYRFAGGKAHARCEIGLGYHLSRSTRNRTRYDDGDLSESWKSGLDVTTAIELGLAPAARISAMLRAERLLFHLTYANGTSYYWDGAQYVEGGDSQIWTSGAPGLGLDEFAFSAGIVCRLKHWTRAR